MTYGLLRAERYLDEGEWNTAHRQPIRHCSRVAMPLTNRSVASISLIATQSRPTQTTDATISGYITRLLSTVT